RGREAWFSRGETVWMLAVFSWGEGFATGVRSVVARTTATSASEPKASCFSKAPPDPLTGALSYHYALLKNRDGVLERMRRGGGVLHKIEKPHDRIRRLRVHSFQTKLFRFAHLIAPIVHLQTGLRPCR